MAAGIGGKASVFHHPILPDRMFSGEGPLAFILRAFQVLLEIVPIRMRLFIATSFAEGSYPRNEAIKPPS